MDISKILLRYYIDNEWCCGETYETLEWHDEVKPKPSKEHLELLYDDFPVVLAKDPHHGPPTGGSW